jgi:molybdopterin synthase catalytic subunit
MKVRVLLFATYREVAGKKELEVELPPGATLQDLLSQVGQTHPRLKPFEDSMLVAVNQEFVDPGTRLKAGDEVALLPPVSGGAGMTVRLQDAPIDTEEVLATVRDTAAGAVVLFLGSVRADPGVESLEYEAYDAMAVKKLTELRDAAVRKFSLTAMSIVHRRGRVPLGEASVAVAASSPHRAGAFAAAAWAMDEVKRIVPIWKTEG